MMVQRHKVVVAIMGMVALAICALCLVVSGPWLVESWYIHQLKKSSDPSEVVATVNTITTRRFVRGTAEAMKRAAHDDEAVMRDSRRDAVFASMDLELIQGATERAVREGMLVEADVVALVAPSFDRMLQDLGSDKRVADAAGSAVALFQIVLQEIDKIK